MNKLIIGLLLSNGMYQTLTAAAAQRQRAKKTTPCVKQPFSATMKLCIEAKIDELENAKTTDATAETARIETTAKLLTELGKLQAKHTSTQWFKDTRKRVRILWGKLTRLTKSEYVIVSPQSPGKQEPSQVKIASPKPVAWGPQPLISVRNEGPNSAYPRLPAWQASADAKAMADRSTDRQASLPQAAIPVQQVELQQQPAPTPAPAVAASTVAWYSPWRILGY